MIIIVPRQSVVDDLLQDDHKMVDEVLISWCVLLYLLLEVIQSTCHYTWVLITEGFLHLQIHLLDWHNVVELYENHDCFFPNHFMLVLQQQSYSVLNGQHHGLIRQLSQAVQRSYHLEMIARLKVLLHGRDHEDYHFAVFVDEQGCS